MLFWVLDMEEEDEDAQEKKQNDCLKSFCDLSIKNDDTDDDDDDETIRNAAFWESQEELLMATLFRTTKFEATVRRATRSVLRELDSVGGVRCSCNKTEPLLFCRTCSEKEVSLKLQNSGFDCVICKSHWKSSTEMLAGQHTYLEVSAEKGETKVIIDLDFRAEFEMARASKEYNQLIIKLPQVFVGKAERLVNLVNILCAASKKCMKDRKMHLAPWRRQDYMQAKWRGTPLHKSAPPPPPPPPSIVLLKAPPKPTASLLTFYFLETLPAAPQQHN